MNRFYEKAENCDHCWHMTQGPVYVSLKDGYIHQTCCDCGMTRTVHQSHCRRKHED